MNSGLKILFVFVDGLGLGADDPAVNPLAERGRFPALEKILSRSVPLDAALGVPGLPQSATGQAALLTGLNAPQMMGRHIEGFPPPRLKELVQEHNIFSKLRAAGKTCTFANAYWIDDAAHIPPRRVSVTTVATLAAFGCVRGRADLLVGRAVSHDLTREHIRRDRGYDGSLITPEEAAEHLIGIANGHDFTLFEFFETDRAGHSGDRQMAERVLTKLDCFVGELLRFEGVLIFTSDHGNIENMTVRTHTMNPVPLFFQCLRKNSKPTFNVFQGMQNICELTPKLLCFACFLIIIRYIFKGAVGGSNSFFRNRMKFYWNEKNKPTCDFGVIGRECFSRTGSGWNTVDSGSRRSLGGTLNLGWKRYSRHKRLCANYRRLHCTK